MISLGHGFHLELEIMRMQETHQAETTRTIRYMPKELNAVGYVRIFR
jgi:hypothetical protein